MISSNAFNYVNVLSKAADAALTRNEVLVNNLANVDTPGYKRKDVQFESYLQGALRQGGTLDQKVANLNLSSLNPTTYTDLEQMSYRLDGNNVDVDTEESYLAQNQIRYNALLDSMTQEFNRIKIVLAK